jgi:hypothetical protein
MVQLCGYLLNEFKSKVEEKYRKKLLMVIFPHGQCKAVIPHIARKLLKSEQHRVQTACAEFRQNRLRI